MKPSVHTAVFLIVIFSSTLVSAQDDSVTVSTRQTVRLPYEVVVTPTVTRANLRRLIVQVEEDFAARFNELNMDDNYDVLCYKYTPTGSHRSRRVCEPSFLIQARGQNASENAYMLSQNIPRAHELIYVFTPKILRKEVNTEYNVLQSKVEELTRTDVELRSMIVAIAELTERLKNFGK